MTVEKLIELLSDFQQDLEVLIAGMDNVDFVDIDNPSIITAIPKITIFGDYCYASLEEGGKRYVQIT